MKVIYLITYINFLQLFKANISHYLTNMIITLHNRFIVENRNLTEFLILVLVPTKQVDDDFEGFPVRENVIRVCVFLWLVHWIDAFFTNIFLEIILFKTQLNSSSYFFQGVSMNIFQRTFYVEYCPFSNSILFSEKIYNSIISPETCLQIVGDSLWNRKRWPTRSRNWTKYADKP